MGGELLTGQTIIDESVSDRETILALQKKSHSITQLCTVDGGACISPSHGSQSTGDSVPAKWGNALKS